MDSGIGKALKRKRELTAELNLLDEYIALHNRLFGNDEPVDAQENSISESDHSPKRRNNPAKIADAAERVIRELRRPVQRSELVDLIEAGGLTIHSDDKPRYIGTVLWRNSEKFVNLEGQGYIVKGMDNAEDLLSS